MKAKKENRGSMTLEAAIVVPIFIFIMLTVNGFFILFLGNQVVEHALIQSVKSLAYDPYAVMKVNADAEDEIADVFVDVFSFTSKNHTSTEEWFKKDYDGDLEEVIEDRFVAYLHTSRDNADSLLEYVGVKDGLEGMDFSGSSIDDDNYLTVKVTYTQEYIFNLLDLTSFEREQTLKVKLFTYNYK